MSYILNWIIFVRGKFNMKAFLLSFDNQIEPNEILQCRLIRRICVAKPLKSLFQYFVPRSLPFRKTSTTKKIGKFLHKLKEYQLNAWLTSFWYSRTSTNVSAFIYERHSKTCAHKVIVLIPLVLMVCCLFLWRFFQTEIGTSRFGKWQLPSKM